MMDPPLISPSMRAAFKSCGRKVFFRYIAGIEPVRKSVPLRMGSAFHAGLERWRMMAPGERNGSIAHAVADSVFRTSVAGEIGEADMDVYASQLQAYLLGYFKRFSGIDAGSHFVEVQAFDDDSGETGFMDSMLIDENGRRWIIEDKTTASFVEAEVMKMSLRLNDQLLTYALALFEKGHGVPGVRFRQVKKTGTWQTKKETAIEYAVRIAKVYETEDSLYREFVIEFTERELLDFAKRKSVDNLDVLQWLDITELDEFPLNSASCLGLYGPCDYLALCTRGCDGSQRSFKPNGKKAIDNGEYQKRIWNIEGSGSGGSGTGSGGSGRGAAAASGTFRAARRGDDADFASELDPKAT